MTSPNEKLNISPNGLVILKDYEKFSAKWYLCSSKKWTIGWGHVRTSKDRFDTVTLEEADKLLQSDCLIAETCIKKFVKVALNQNQFDALTTFVFNIGITAFSESTILRLLNEGKFEQASEQFGRWIYPESSRRGLIKRRNRECALFLKPIDL